MGRPNRSSHDSLCAPSTGSPGVIREPHRPLGSRRCRFGRPRRPERAIGSLARRYATPTTATAIKLDRDPCSLFAVLRQDSGRPTSGAGRREIMLSHPRARSRPEDTSGPATTLAPIPQSSVLIESLQEFPFPTDRTRGFELPLEVPWRNGGTYHVSCTHGRTPPRCLLSVSSMVRTCQIQK